MKLYNHLIIQTSYTLISNSMSIIVNGKAQQLSSQQVSLLELIKQNNVQQPDMVSVQLNGAFVNREDFESIIIKAGDEIDFLYFMGGGSRC